MAVDLKKELPIFLRSVPVEELIRARDRLLLIIAAVQAELDNRAEKTKWRQK